MLGRGRRDHDQARLVARATGPDERITEHERGGRIGQDLAALLVAIQLAGEAGGAAVEGVVHKDGARSVKRGEFPGKDLGDDVPRGGIGEVGHNGLEGGVDPARMFTTRAPGHGTMRARPAPMPCVAPVIQTTVPCRSAIPDTDLQVENPTQATLESSSPSHQFATTDHVAPHADEAVQRPEGVDEGKVGRLAAVEAAGELILGSVPPVQTRDDRRGETGFSGARSSCPPGRSSQPTAPSRDMANICSAVAPDAR